MIEYYEEDDCWIKELFHDLNGTNNFSSEKILYIVSPCCFESGAISVYEDDREIQCYLMLK